jgi:phosphoserine aminotransferase
VPPQSELNFSGGAAYVHYTPNETISGVEFAYVPQTGGVPLIADMSSSILSQPTDVSRFGLIYAGAQKNIAPAGLTVVIVREDLIGRARAETPRVFDYRAIADSQSMLNTPPTFAWYVAGLVFKWLKRSGGVAAAGARNEAKSRALYAAIDGSALYRNAVAKDARSRMNVTFTLNRPELEGVFLTQAAEAGLHGLKGHRALGGMRASIYNAMPLAGVDALIAFMREFEHRHA